jgi:hypothetical protein
MGKRGFCVFSTFFAFLIGFWGLFGAISGFWHPCHVHTFMCITSPPTRVSRFGGENLAFDKETGVDGRGLTAKGAKDAKGESGDGKGE